MTQSVYRLVMAELATKSPERAGLLLGPDDEPDLVTHFAEDRGGRSSAASFTLDPVGLNAVIRRVRGAGLACNGIVHSHPPGICRPSIGDLAYLAKLFRNPKNEDLDRTLFPIVANGRLYPFIVEARDTQRVVCAELILI